MVNLIVIFPAFAVSELLLNRSCPDGSAASDSSLAALAGDGAEEVAELEVGVDALLDAVELELELAELLLLEPPHAAITTVAAIAAIETIGPLFTEVLLSLDTGRRRA